MGRTLSLVCIITMMSTAQTQKGFYYQRDIEISHPRTNAYQNQQSRSQHYTIAPVFYNLSTNLELTARTNKVERQERTQEAPRIENGTYKILNRLQTINKRGGHRNHLLAILLKELQATIGALEESVADDNDRVVFPGPTSASRPIKLIIPEECKRRGYCENVPNHPVNLVEDAIKGLGDKVKYLQMDSLPPEDEIAIVQRLGGGTDVDISLCISKTTILYPESAQDKDGKWYTVLNLPNHKVQGFLAEVCDSPQPTACSPLMSAAPGYSSACIQKYVFRVMQALDSNENQVQVPLKLPSCCSCVLHKNDNI